MRKPRPTVVPSNAAQTVRSFVFEHRLAAGIDPREVVTKLLADGHGGSFPSALRGRRLRTWVLQVLRRLRKHGWVGAPSQGKWPTTAALKSCSDPRALVKRAPRETEPEPPTPPQTPPESWGSFVQDWVVQHRHAAFGVAEVAVVVVQRGYGTGDIGDRLDAARAHVEGELASLEEDGLLRFKKRSDLWEPTVLLRTWPIAEGPKGD